MKKIFLVLSVTAAVVTIFAVFGKSISGREVKVERDYAEKLYFDENYKCASCNIVLISIDTLRADHLGCYGYSRNTTPNIDEFAKESILFENAYSQAPSTVPALRSIMTGRLIANESKEDIISYYYNTTYLAEILHKRGYLTVGFTDHYAPKIKHAGNGVAVVTPFKANVHIIVLTKQQVGVKIEVRHAFMIHYILFQFPDLRFTVSG